MATKDWKIVQFSNGQYGIQTRKASSSGIIQPQYLDLDDNGAYSWGTEDRYFNKCQSPSLEKVKKIYNEKAISVERYIDPGETSKTNISNSTISSSFAAGLSQSQLDQTQKIIERMKKDRYQPRRSSSINIKDVILGSLKFLLSSKEQIDKIRKSTFWKWE